MNRVVSHAPALALLGPQRRQPFVDEAADGVGARGRMAVITAGWEEEERNDDELRAALGRDSVNLELRARADRLFDEHPALLEAHRERRARRDELREIYRIRLAHLVDCAQALLDRTGREPGILDVEQESVLNDVRRLDGHHAERVRKIRDQDFRATGVVEHPAIARARDEVRAVLETCSGIAIAGGHVRVLLDALLLFDLDPWLRRLPVIAWSAGAMVLAERVMLFHDTPPQGPNAAEAHAPGLGVHEGIIPFPHARRRLRLNDTVRVSVLARRLEPAFGLTMDDGAMLRFDGPVLVEARGVRRLLRSGGIALFEAGEVDPSSHEVTS